MKKDLSRRQFLHRTAGAAGALAASPAIFLEPEHIPFALQSTPPSDRLRFGIIGIGMQGAGLLRNALPLPAVECVPPSAPHAAPPAPPVAPPPARVSHPAPLGVITRHGLATNPPCYPNSSRGRRWEKESRPALPDILLSLVVSSIFLILG